MNFRRLTALARMADADMGILFRQTAAAGFANDMPDDFRVSITDSPGKGAYPISGMTWLLVYEKQKDTEKGKKLVGFLNWALRDGQKNAPDLHCAPLPPAVATKALASLAKITVQ